MGNLDISWHRVVAPLRSSVPGSTMSKVHIVSADAPFPIDAMTFVVMSSAVDQA